MSQQTIGFSIGACRDTVNKSIKYFVEQGWLSVIKRPRRTNIYKINSCLSKCNPKDPKTFLKEPEKPEKIVPGRGGGTPPVSREKPTPKPTVLLLPSLHSYNLRSAEAPRKSYTDDTPIRPYVQNKVSWVSPHKRDLLILQASFTDADIANAVESYMSITFKAHEPIALMTHFCKKAKKQRLARMSL